MLETEYTLKLIIPPTVKGQGPFCALARQSLSCPEPLGLYIGGVYGLD